eukprot:gene12048-16123_t
MIPQAFAEVTPYEEPGISNRNIDHNSPYDLASSSMDAIPVVRAIEIPQATSITAWIIETNNLYFNPTSSILPASNDPLDQDQAQLHREKVLISIYRVSRLIRIVASLDIIFIALVGIFTPIFFIILPFPLSGYFGARWWKYRLLFIYVVYVVAEIFGAVISLIYIDTPYFLAIRITYLVFNVFIVRYVIKLCSYISVFEDEDLDFFKNSQIIINMEKKRYLC